jgi:WD40 repeat protein
MCVFAQVWKVADAHDDVIRDVAWSPLMPHWLASAGDDGCVQVFRCLCAYMYSAFVFGL